MYCGKRLAVVLPAYNEQHAILQVMGSMPGFVDVIAVVDDASTDRTPRLLAELEDPRLSCVRHEKNRGVGAAIASGYKKALELGVDLVVVMGADGQMDPHDLPRLLDPAVHGDADYVKGNRFLEGEAFRAMPLSRYAGNVALSWLTRAATGRWELFDSQCGYTVATADILKRLDLDKVFPRYGVPIDLLDKILGIGGRIAERPVRPLYPKRHTHMKPIRVVLPILGLLAAIWRKRHRQPKTWQAA